MIALINSDPLSESIPAILNGNLADAVLMASNTYFCALFLHATVVSQHVAISVKFKLWAKSPEVFSPS